MESKSKYGKLRTLVFWPPWLLLIGIVVISFVNNEAFLHYLDAVTSWILDNFAWAFNGLTIFCVITVIMVYFSPLGKVRIGGSKARPMMKYSNWLWVTLCTTVAAGLLFWACAEPLYHYQSPPAAMGIEGGTPAAAQFSLEALFLDWTWPPYSLYCVCTLSFCFAYYNMKKPNSLSAPLTLLCGDGVLRYATVIDLISLFAIAAGMAGSMGTGILSIAGGVENVFGIESEPVMWAFIAVITGALFIISSISGIMKGIKTLSTFNVYLFFIITVLLFVFGPTAFMLNTTVEAVGAFFSDFFRIGLMTGELFGDGWAKSWPNFYFCNWLSWAPLCGLFLGRIAVGYTVRDTIKCNFIIPSLFSTLWIGLFSSATLFYEFADGSMSALMAEKGTESIVYAVIGKLPLSMILVPLYILIVFVSFVTACDSNTSAISGLCVEGDSEADASNADKTSPMWLKIVWGVTITVISWVMISSSGIDGIKAVSNLGGFPNMFLVFMMALGLWRVAGKPVKFDLHKEDYDALGNPLPSKRLESQEAEESRQAIKKRRKTGIEEKEQ